MITEVERTLNDAFVVMEHIPEHARTGYKPGDVDREKIFKAWEQLYAKQGKQFPTTPERLMQVSDSVLQRSLEILSQGKNAVNSRKAQAYAYFCTLLCLKAVMLMGDAKEEKVFRSRLRSIEMTVHEEELIPH